MRKPGQIARRFDRLQQSRPWIAVAVATWRKFGDDQAGNLAALIAYFAFASIFPLLLVLVTILDLIARSNPNLGTRLRAALHDYPVIGTQVASSVKHGVSGTGIALVIGILLTLYAGRGVASAIQNALNTVWGVPLFRRPGFPRALLRSLGLLAIIGPGELVTIALSSIAGGTGHLGGALAKAAAILVSLLLNIGLFWLAFRMATAPEVATRNLRLSAILAAIAWQVLQLIGGYLVGHELKTTSAYGTFGVVLGLLAWFYLQAQITLYVTEFDVVRVLRLWPRSLAPPPLSDADVRAYQLYAKRTQLRPDLEIEVRAAPQAPAGAGQAEPQ
jgi:membrane protein